MAKKIEGSSSQFHQHCLPKNYKYLLYVQKGAQLNFSGPLENIKTLWQYLQLQIN